MKHFSTYLLSLLFITPFASANALQKEQTNKKIDNTPDQDFLEFLVEMEELTGEGFDDWLEQDKQIDEDNIQEENTHEN